MKTFSKTMTAGLIVASLSLLGCSSPTADTPKGDEGPVLTALPLSFEGSLNSNWSASAGHQNGATIAALSLDTTNNGVISAGGRNYAYGSVGTKTWPVSVDLGTQTLKFVLRTDASTSGSANENSHVVVSFKNVDFGAMATKTGIEFDLKVPSGPASIGLSPVLRYRTASEENAAVFTAPLQDPSAEDFAVSSTVYDWVYFGDGVFLHFKVPFTAFSVPGWAPDSAKAHASVAAALTAGVKFNEFTLDFRFATKDAAGGLPDTNYDAFLDNVALY